MTSDQSTIEPSCELVNQEAQAGVSQLAPLTGMRFFAAMAVVGGHLVTDHNGDGLGRFGLPQYSVVLAGAAVSFFFVLSGFILTYVYKDRLTYKSVPRFYFKRWARIWPLHLACLIIAIYAINLVVNNWPMFWTNLTLLQSWVPRQPWVFSFNGVSWSISVEMFFYIVFPFFLIGGQKRFWAKYLIVWAIVLGCVWGVQALANSPDYSKYHWARAAQINPLLRLPEFLTGMGVGFLFFNRFESRNKHSYSFDTAAEIIAICLIPAYSFVYRHFSVTQLVNSAEWGGLAMAMWVQYAGMMFVFGIVIYVFSRSRGFFASLLGSRLIVFGGEISFALYMIHYLVFIGIERFDWSGSSYYPGVLATCVVVISLCLACLLYLFVEMPAKTALMNLYDGNYRKAIATAPTQFLKCFTKPAYWTSLVLLVGAIGVASMNYTPLVLSERSQQVIAASHQPYRDVYFAKQIRLMGAKATATDKGIDLEMVWQKKWPMTRQMFFHLCDDKGEILTQLPPEKNFFRECPFYEPTIQKVFVPSSVLADDRITQIGIGFFSSETNPETGKVYPMLRVSKGLRGLMNFRLNVISTNEMKNLRFRMAELNASKTEND